MAPSIFPTYLLPSIPFHRHSPKSTNKPTSHTPTPLKSSILSSLQPNTTAPTTLGTTPPSFLHSHKSYLRCLRCSADLCLTSQIISKCFTGRHGRAYLVSASPSTDGISIAPSSSSLQRASLPNTVTQQALPRHLVTGVHTVSDITCRFCGSLLGWKYVAAEEESQKYKVGKFILETKRVSVCSSWEDEEGVNGDGVGGGGGRSGCYSRESLDGKEIEFDSQDEEECEDLFSGMWSPWLAARRRRDKRELEGRAFGEGRTR
ncbi:hypothetical protein AJ79_00110 [Helicocarpus griseus UAMH5409]|uniref:Yippee domain-containing protein n=1 Tax=Helicocarpus griseus UAMH5409 TaxID=1447875 RepID=A0A2B7YC14_9EURO|nr:hypothetical protein AJ79_00110 [Helicocarpus griseus UAMH5409]